MGDMRWLMLMGKGGKMDGKEAGVGRKGHVIDSDILSCTAI